MNISTIYVTYMNTYGGTCSKLICQGDWVLNDAVKFIKGISVQYLLEMRPRLMEANQITVYATTKDKTNKYKRIITLK